MTFRIVDLIARLDGTPQRAYRMCDASGEGQCVPNSGGVPVDTTPPPDDHDQGPVGGPSGRKDDAGPRDKNDQGGCGGKQALPMLRAQLRRSLQEPPASPW